MPILLPWLTIFIFKSFFEFFHPAGFSKLLLEICQMRKRTTESLHLIEDTKKYIDDRIFILLAAGVALGIDVEKDHIGRRFCGKFHICQHHRISDFLVFHKEVKCPSVTDPLVRKKIGQDLQEVRFTTSKEAGDPYAHLRCSSENAFLICREEISKVFLQLPGDNILIQFLRDVGFLALADNDNTLDLTVDRLSEHFFYLHFFYLRNFGISNEPVESSLSFIDSSRTVSLLSAHQPECPVIIVILDFVEQDQFLFVISSGKEHNYRNPYKCLMQVIQHFM